MGELSKGEGLWLFDAVASHERNKYTHEQDALLKQEASSPSYSGRSMQRERGVREIII
jgi:hypothetical protein